MKNSVSSLLATAGVLAVASLTGTAHADIIGFGDYTTDWRYQQFDSSTSLGVAGNGIRLSTAAGGSQYRNIFNTARQDVTRFNCSFVYTSSTVSSYSSATTCGLSLVLFANAVASNGATPSGGNQGYYGYYRGNIGSSNENLLFNSVSLVLSPRPINGSGNAGVFSGGVVGGGVPGTGSVVMGNNNPVRVNVRYNQPGDLAGFVYYSLTDLTSGAVFNGNPTLLNVPSSIGGSTAFVGFTTNAYYNEQVITDFSFVSVPSPAAAALLGLAGLSASRRRR